MGKPQRKLIFLQRWLSAVHRWPVVGYHGLTVGESFDTFRFISFHLKRKHLIQDFVKYLIVLLLTVRIPVPTSNFTKLNVHGKNSFKLVSKVSEGSGISPFMAFEVHLLSNPTLWVGFEELCDVEGKLFSSFLLITAINKFFS